MNYDIEKVVKFPMCHYLVLFLLSIAAFGVHSETLMPDIMESRNLVTAHEMVTDGNWLMPTMNGALRLAKPPFPTWVAALSEVLISPSLWAMRLVPGLMGLLLLVYFYRFAFNLTDSRRYSFTSSLVLFTCYNFVMMGRMATWDIYCHAFMMAAIFYLYRMWSNRGGMWKNATFAGLFMGLSLLSKGPVSFYALLLPYGIALVFSLRGSRVVPEGRSRATYVGQLLWPLLLLLVVGCWWYVAVYVVRSHESVGVWTGESNSWMNHNVRPWYYYSTFFVELGAWALLTLFSFAWSHWRKQLGGYWKVYRFCFLWMVACVVLLSLLPEKKNRYLLPVLVPAALTIGMQLHYWMELGKDMLSKVNRVDRTLFAVHTVVLSLVCVAGVVVIWLMKPSAFVSVSLWLMTFCLILAAMVLLSAVRGFRVNRMLWAVVGIFVSVEVFGLPLVNNMLGNKDYRPLSLLQQDKRSESLPLYHFEDESLRIELVYDAKRKIQSFNDNSNDTLRLGQMLPCVILARQGAADSVRTWRLAERVGARCVALGKFDSNRHPSTSKRYKDDFLYQAILVEPKYSKK